MADERYEWLDHEAAERLLCGEPVDADDDYTRLQAERLAEALESARADAARTRTGPAGALPGEEAALTAFRAARSTRVDGRAPGTGRDLGAVRIGGSPRPAGRTRARAWTRPARWGLAASVAGLAVGGVAVAAGTGVLPDFGGDAAPVPAASASAPMELDTPDGVAVTPRGSTRPVTPPHPDGPTPPGASLPATGGPDATAGSDGTADNDGADRGHADDEYWAGGDKRAPGGAWPDRTTQACRDYRDGHLDGARRQQLELSAKAGGGIERFCDEVLSGRGSGGTSTGATGATGDPESVGGGDGDGDGSGGTTGAKPGGTTSGGTSSGGRTSGGTTSGGKVSGGRPSGGKASGGKASGGAGGSASAVSWTVPLTSAPRATL